MHRSLSFFRYLNRLIRSALCHSSFRLNNPSSQPPPVRQILHSFRQLDQLSMPMSSLNWSAQNWTCCSSCSLTTVFKQSIYIFICQNNELKVNLLNSIHGGSTYDHTPLHLINAVTIKLLSRWLLTAQVNWNILFSLLLDGTFSSLLPFYIFESCFYYAWILLCWLSSRLTLHEVKFLALEENKHYLYCFWQGAQALAGAPFVWPPKQKPGGISSDPSRHLKLPHLLALQ